MTPTARIQTTASTVALHHAASRTVASRVGTHRNTLGYVLGVSRSGPKKDATAQPGSLVCTISNHFNANSPSTVVGTPASTCQKSCTCPAITQLVRRVPANGLFAQPYLSIPEHHVCQVWVLDVAHRRPFIRRKPGARRHVTRAHEHNADRERTRVKP